MLKIYIYIHVHMFLTSWYLLYDIEIIELLNRGPDF